MTVADPPRRAQRQIRRPRTAAARPAALLAVAAVLASACTAAPVRAESAPPPDRPVTQAAPAARAVSTSTSTTTAAATSWAKSFGRLQEQLSGPAGVAVFPVGSTRSADLLTVGTWKSGVAWSTSKVPVTIAAQRRSTSKATRSRSTKAITVSDNRAAEQLWASLGTPRKAAARTQDVIRDAGDRSTVVQSRRVRAGFTAFGQTTWDLDDQARFAAGLPCLPDAKNVVSLMGQITRSQRWGLGQLPRTRFKGGWGPVGRGYLVRQLGVITLPDGSKVGVAIAVSSPRGFERGTRDLTTVARWLGTRVDDLDGGRCPRK